MIYLRVVQAILSSSKMPELLSAMYMKLAQGCPSKAYAAPCEHAGRYGQPGPEQGPGRATGRTPFNFTKGP